MATVIWFLGVHFVGKSRVVVCDSGLFLKNSYFCEPSAKT